MELVAFDYFNIIIYAFVGMILGFLAYDHFRIRFNLSIFEDKTTNLVYLTVILYALVLSYIIIINAVFNNLGIPIPSFIQASAVNILRAFAPVFLGAVTIFIGRGEKQREKAEKLQTEIVSPLYLAIRDIKKDLLGDHPLIRPTQARYYERWEKIEGTDLERKSVQLDAEIPLFFDNVKAYLTDLDKISKNISYQINRSFDEIVLKPLNLDYEMTVDGNDSFTVRYFSSIEWLTMPLKKHMILGIDPITWTKDRDIFFSSDRCMVQVTRYESDSEISVKDVELNYERIEVSFTALIGWMEEVLCELEYIEIVRSERTDLLEESDRLLELLEGIE